jgi:hypothetical protein
MSANMSGALRRAVSRLIGWVTGLWRRPSSHEQSSPKALPRAKRARSRKDGTVTKKTIGALLDDLDFTFSRLKKADNSASWTDKELRDGLRRLGPTILWGDESYAAAPLRSGKMPALVFTGIPLADAGETIYAKFAYASKVSRFHHAVREAKPGVRYECGICFAMENSVAVRDEEKQKLFWFNFAATVDPETWAVSVCTTKIPVIQRLPRGGTIHHSRWGHLFDDVPGFAQKIAELAFFTHRMRSQSWLVSCRKDGHRATFCIPDNRARSFFVDRERTALSPTGRMKPIMHFVRGHARVIGSGRETEVKEHIRGLRRFTWNGYSCAITSPEFHSFNADKFTTAGMDEEEYKGDGPVMTMKNLGGFLADCEDDQVAPKPRLTLVHSADREAA